VGEDCAFGQAQVLLQIVFGHPQTVPARWGGKRGMSQG
jgi:hypothetical protein